MYFVKQFYSHEAWQRWKVDKKAIPLPVNTTSDYYDSSKNSTQARCEWMNSITFAPVESFAELVERAAFLQLLNKRHVLYFRGREKDYWKDTDYPGLDLPSMLRPPTPGERLKPELLTERWTDLELQCKSWKQLLWETHPRRQTLKHYPETVWAVQQHYKDLLPAPTEQCKQRKAESLFLDVSHSLRVAAAFALACRTKATEPAFVSVIALPQTTGSITFDADEQLQLMRLAALCPPEALRPQLQEGYLVGRFPHPSLQELTKKADDLLYLEEFYSLRRRTVAIIPMIVNAEFFGPYGTLRSEEMLRCPWFASVGSSWDDGGLTFNA